MNDIPTIDMLKLLGLTREGRLKEAMAKLRGTTTAPGIAPVAGLHLPELPALKGLSLKDLARRLGDLTGAAADLDPPGRSRPEVPKDARFLQRTYSGAEGSLNYKLFIPNRYNGTPLPLLVMLHGCTQSPDDFALGTGMNRLAEEQGFLVAYPAQARSANVTKCWNWFNTENQQRGQGEAALLAGITSEVMRGYAIRPGRVYVAGLSAGGAMAAILGGTYPELFAAVGVHSGLARGAAHDMPSAFTAMSQGGGATPPTGRAVPTIVFHGDRDHTVNPANAARVLAQARGVARGGARGGAVPGAAQVTQGKTAGGVTYTRTVETSPAGQPVLEYWAIHGAGHAWAGGNAAGTYTDPTGPDASREMLRFFLAQPEGN